MARSGMADLITELRGMCDAGTADFAIGTINYWSDDHLQAALDMHRTDVNHEYIQPTSTVNTSNQTVYVDFYTPFRNLESGTVTFIQDLTGAAVGTADYTVDYFNGKITFDNDTGGSVLHLTTRVYDLNLAAADIWKRKAANAAKMFDFSTDNHSIKRSQFMANCNAMAAQYASMAGIQTGDLVRTDIHDDAFNR